MPNTSAHLKMDYQPPIHRAMLTIVPNRPPGTRLLLAEAHGDSLSTRNLLLSKSGYKVATASTRKELFDLRFLGIHLVILSDSLGSLGLRSFAEDVRRQWPLARVLIIGAAQVVLDDPLYDEAVGRRISPTDLLAAITNLSTYSASERVEVFRSNTGRVNQEEALEHYRESVPVESDPTKEPGYGGEAKEGPQDLPADEHRQWGKVE
jgi:hypothetical protein